MTKHWPKSVDQCAGCIYLRAYGLPEDFIREDHDIEVGGGHLAPTPVLRHVLAVSSNRKQFECTRCGQEWMDLESVRDPCPGSRNVDIQDKYRADNPHSDYVSSGVKASTRMRCNECGRKFSRRLGAKTTEVKCPKCGGYDTEVA